MRSSRLVAEALRVMPLPIGGALPPPARDGVRTLGSRWQQAWIPHRSPAAPPSFLHIDQVDSWRRAIAALERWNGVIVADAVGSGKSWVALAVALHYGHPATVVGPAALEAQWRRVADRVGVGIEWISHERLSRGGILPEAAELAIVDEAHRFRHLRTRRTAQLAPWLAGRPSMMLTATPLVNRRTDLVALLRLLFADDVLTLDGLPSLRQLEESRTPPPALRRLLIRANPTADSLPVLERRLECNSAENQRGHDALAVLARLRLGDTVPVRNLLAAVLLDAAASSNAAWRAALQRYRALLLQSRDAGGLSRAALRQFAGHGLEQLVFWPLLGALPTEGAPPLADLEVVDRALLNGNQHEPWLGAVRQLLSDKRPTVCFARHRATAALLTKELGDGTAWITGLAGGIGPHHLPREQVLAAFGTARAEWRVFRQIPDCLVATEVLSEGLDLQGASRVVHLDLPWHAARLEQRVGRVRRLGQVADNVEVVTRVTAAPIERLLHQAARIRRKGRLASRWLDALSLEPAMAATSEHATWMAVAPSTGGTPEAIAMIGLRAGEIIGTMPLELHDGIWQLAAEPTRQVPEVYPDNTITTVERARLRRLARRAVWRAIELARPAVVSRPRLVGRLLTLGRQARITRDRQQMEVLDQLLTAASRAVPLGTALQLDALGEAPERALLAARPTLPPPPAAAELQWLAVVLFRPGKSALR